MEGLFFVGWLALCGIVSFIASHRRRGPIAWFFAAFFLSPLIGYATLVAIPMGDAE